MKSLLLLFGIAARGCQRASSCEADSFASQSPRRPRHARLLSEVYDEYGVCIFDLYDVEYGPEAVKHQATAPLGVLNAHPGDPSNTDNILDIFSVLLSRMK